MALGLLLRVVQHITYGYSRHALVSGEGFLYGVAAPSQLRFLLCVFAVPWRELAGGYSIGMQDQLFPRQRSAGYGWSAFASESGLNATAKAMSGDQSSRRVVGVWTATLSTIDTFPFCSRTQNSPPTRSEGWHRRC